MLTNNLRLFYLDPVKERDTRNVLALLLLQRREMIVFDGATIFSFRLEIRSVRNDKLVSRKI